MKVLFLLGAFRQGCGGAPESIRLMARELAGKGISSDVHVNGRLHREVEALDLLPVSDDAAPFDMEALGAYRAVLQVSPWQRFSTVRSIVNRLGPDQTYLYLPRGGLADIEFVYRKGWQKRAYFAALERRFVRRADRIIFSSRAEQIASTCIARYAEKAEIIPDFFSGDTSPGTELGSETGGSARAVGFMAEIGQRKGLLPLVEAYREWSQALAGRGRAHEAILRVGGAIRPGAEGYFAQVTALARTLAEGRVRFEGPIAHSARATFYRTLDLFVVPSLFESYGLTVLEALSTGCPVVCGPNIGVLEYLPSHPQLVVAEAPTPTALATALDQARNAGVDRARTAAVAKEAVAAINAQALRSWSALLAR